MASRDRNHERSRATDILGRLEEDILREVTTAMVVIYHGPQPDWPNVDLFKAHIHRARALLSTLEHEIDKAFAGAKDLDKPVNQPSPYSGG